MGSSWDLVGFVQNGKDGAVSILHGCPWDKKLLEMSFLLLPELAALVLQSAEKGCAAVLDALPCLIN